MLKKLSLLSIILLSLLLLNFKKEKTELVYSEKNSDTDYRQIYLLFENNNLNTNNFNDYFKDIKVLKVYPYINPIYAGKIKANYNYSFTRENYELDLEKFKNNYINKLREIGLQNEANNCQMSGVIINKVLIYEPLSKIKNNISEFNVKYSFNLNGEYKNF